MDYSPSKLRRCLAIVRNDEVSIEGAEILFGIPKRTIFSRLKEPTKKVNRPGRPTVFSAAEEDSMVEHLLLLAEYDMPITGDDLKVVVKNYLEADGRTVERFKDNFPGKDWLSGFLRRHPVLSSRVAENVKIVKAAVSETMLRNYITHLEKTIEGIPSSNIYNCDETNLTDNPIRKRVKFSIPL